METQSSSNQQRAAELGGFDEILRDLDAWAAGAAALPQANDAATLAAQARVLVLECGLYALRAAGGGDTHIAVAPNEPRGAVRVVAADHRPECWLADHEDVAIVKVRAPAGRLLITRHGASAASPLEIVPLSPATTARSAAGTVGRLRPRRSR